ncbi:MAG: TonB-dependent receptor [Bacteroidales bacterium]|nr:TonB-dependent receptor [Bacteroidales bacterium]
MRYYISLLFALIVSTTYAQNGKIRGTVFEKGTGESLVGVTVLLKGTTIGTMSDLDGKFTIETQPGTYDVQLSYISYQTVMLTNVSVKPGEVTILDEVMLQESATELQEIIVTAEAVRKTEAALLTVKKKSAAMLDGISSAKIRLTGDATAVEAAKRVTGVSIEDGKYVYIRGLGDRYSKTTLNQMEIPGLDPDKNSLQMDIFPTNLIDNILVSKNFTADMPADFTGGLLNVETKAFPEERVISVSLSAAFNPSVHLNPDFITYDGGKTDFLGFDDGTRALPSLARENTIPSPVSGNANQEVFDFISSFNSQLGAKTQQSFVDYSAGISLGDQLTIKRKNSNKGVDPKIGYIFSLSYKQEYKLYDDAGYGEYQRFKDPELYDMRYATISEGVIGEKSVLVGILGGLAFKTQFSKIRFTAMRLQNGESRAAQFTIINDGEAVGQSGYKAYSDNLEYNERSLTNLLLHGDHVFGGDKWELDWRISPTRSTSDDPDIRKTAFTETTTSGLNFSSGAGGNPSRIWRSLDETNTSSKIDLTRKYQLFGSEAKTKLGASHNYKNRSYEILSFDMQFYSGQSWPDPDPNTVLIPENIFPNKPNGIYYQSLNNDPNPNEYKSNSTNIAAYISQEFYPVKQLKAILGLRVEDFVMNHTGRDQKYANGDFENGFNLDNEEVLSSTDLFPSVSLIYAITKDQNLRASFTKTIARPSFKELSYAQIIDPITNRIFNGSLFKYPDWDGNLTETRITNADLRWEWFLERGQMLSASGFFKTFDNPIELVRIPEQQTSTEYQPRNVGDGQLYGFELEFRKDLAFISPTMGMFSLSSNLTYVISEIEMSDVEYNSRKGYEKVGETIERKREMAGQSPYVINAGITYANTEIGIDAGLFYNVKGPTLSIVGGGLFPDIYMLPYNSLNFGINKKFGKEGKTIVDLKISNILNERIESVYQSFKAKDETYVNLNPGITFGIGISYMF